jgi:hypothetical protein
VGEPSAALFSVAENSTDSEEDEEVRVVGGGETLPEGWTEQKDPDSGHPYYYNHARKQSVWEKPQAAASDLVGSVLA